MDQDAVLPTPSQPTDYAQLVAQIRVFRAAVRRLEGLSAGSALLDAGHGELTDPGQSRARDEAAHDHVE